MWECTGGSALAGDDSLTAAMREVREETGLILHPENGKCVISFLRDECFVDIWLFVQDFDLSEVTLLEGETCDAMYATADDLRQLREKAPWCKIVVGGAVLNQAYADAIGADKYAKDAMEAVRYAELIHSNLQ